MTDNVPLKSTLLLKQYQEQLQKEEEERRKEIDAQKKFNAIDFEERLKRYRAYCEMRIEFKEEDHFRSYWGRMPTPDDPNYKKFKLQCILQPDFRYQFESGY